MNTNQISNIAILIGEPARTAMLCTLMHGQSLTATELANSANITPQTASAHLAKLVDARLLTVHRQGRHRYHRLATPEVAKFIESAINLAALTPAPTRPVITGPRDETLRRARTCYDHFAGRLGVAITDSMLKKKWIEFDDEAGSLTSKGAAGLARAGVILDPHNQKPSRRPICRPCLDWSERRPHIAGKVGAAICHHFFHHDLVRRIADSRALQLTAKGQIALREVFSIRTLD